MPRAVESPADIAPDWYLVDWMAHLGVTQAEMVRRTGWSKATTNDIYHGKTRYYRQIVNEAAIALRIQPFEIFMPPAEALALRRIRSSAQAIAAEARLDFVHMPDLDNARG